MLDSVQNDKVAAWYNTATNTTRAIILAIQRQPGANTVEVVDNIEKLLPQFRAADSGRGETGHPVRPFAVHPPSVGDVEHTLSSPCASS